MKTRGFEIVSQYENQNLNLPSRSTHGSAGYDFESAETVVIPSQIKHGVCPPTLVKTGIKAYMQQGEYLQLANRSSNPLKRFLIMANGIGVIDQDYYNNPNNEGHIMMQFINYSKEDIVIEKGEKIGQGIFLKYFTVDQEESPIKERIGGFGSTGL